jgi:hypothetical protein
MQFWVYDHDNYCFPDDAWTDVAVQVEASSASAAAQEWASKVLSEMGDDGNAARCFVADNRDGHNPEKFTVTMRIRIEYDVREGG